MTTRIRNVGVIAGLAMLVMAPFAGADHNSPFGEGWALDPLDRHSDAVDSVDSGMMENATMQVIDAGGPLQLPDVDPRSGLDGSLDDLAAGDAAGGAMSGDSTAGAETGAEMRETMREQSQMVRDDANTMRESMREAARGGRESMR
jgi:hypothetical protein